MKKMKHMDKIIYEFPQVRITDLELEGFLCSSEVTVGTDELKSFWGDSSMTDEDGNTDGTLWFY